MSKNTNTWRRFGGMVEGYGIIDDQGETIIAREAFNGVEKYGDQIIREHNAHEALVDALTLALPYVGSALEDKGYKPGVVDRMTETIRTALALADPPPEHCKVCNMPKGKCRARWSGDTLPHVHELDAATGDDPVSPDVERALINQAKREGRV